MTRGKKLLMMAPLAIAGVVLFSFIGGEVVKLLWNWLMPSIFGLRPLTSWEAFGILALSRILFGGFGRTVNHARWNAGRTREEDREQFRRAVRERFGFTSPETSTPGSGSSSDPGTFR